MAGAALSALHSVALDERPPWQLWRRRLALTNAAAVVRLQGRREREAELRDAWCLRRPGDDPGPAGRLLGAWRALGTRAALVPGQWSATYSRPLEQPQEGFGALFEEVGRSIREAENPVAAAAGAVTIAMRQKPEAESLALWLADAVLAIRLKWPAPVPLIATQVRRSDLRTAASDGGEWLRICAAAYARAGAEAFDLHTDLVRRAGKLAAVAPKLRAKEALGLVSALLSEDALAAGSATGKTTARSGRRFFDRLVSLGVVRELTGRPAFRLYGL